MKNVFFHNQLDLNKMTKRIKTKYGNRQKVYKWIGLCLLSFSDLLHDKSNKHYIFILLKVSSNYIIKDLNFFKNNLIILLEANPNYFKNVSK